MKKLVFVLGAALLCANIALAESGYIQARQGKVLASPESGAEQVAVVKRGDVVEVMQRQGRWVKVKAGESEGWISTLLVGKNAPIDKISVLDDESDALEESARRRASEAPSAAAARGLRNDERMRQSDAGMADFNALQQMEQTGVSEDEAVEFMERED